MPEKADDQRKTLRDMTERVFMVAELVFQSDGYKRLAMQKHRSENFEYREERQKHPGHRYAKKKT